MSQIDLDNKGDNADQIDEQTRQEGKSPGGTTGNWVDQLSGRLQSHGKVNRGKTIEQILAEENAAVEQAIAGEWLGKEARSR